MSERFLVELADRGWNIPRLPFRLVKAIQPAIYEVYLAAGGEGMTDETASCLEEADLDVLAEAVWRACSYVDVPLTFDAFLDLPFSVEDLLKALPAVARAVGLRVTIEGDA
jgi:hypothetical protein